MGTQVKGAIYFVQHLANQLKSQFTSEYLTGFNINKAAREATKMVDSVVKIAYCGKSQICPVLQFKLMEKI